MKKHLILAGVFSVAIVQSQQQHDVYVRLFTIPISYRLGRHVYNKRSKHTDKRYRNMQQHK